MFAIRTAPVPSGRTASVAVTVPRRHDVGTPLVHVENVEFFRRFWRHTGGAPTGSDTACTATPFRSTTAALVIRKLDPVAPRTGTFVQPRVPSYALPSPCGNTTLCAGSARAAAAIPARNRSSSWVTCPLVPARQGDCRLQVPVQDIGRRLRRVLLEPGAPEVGRHESAVSLSHGVGGEGLLRRLNPAQISRPVGQSSERT